MNEPEIVELAFPVPRLEGVTGQGPVLVHGLGGYADAGHAVRIATRHLRESLETEKVASFAVDDLIDYRSRRPMMTFDNDRFTGYERPELTLSAVRDDAGTPFLLLSGFEPDLKWERFAAAVHMLVEKLGVRRTIGLAAFPMGVPHTRPLSVLAHGDIPAHVGDQRHWDADIRVPATVSMMLEKYLADRGHKVCGYSVQVPHYLAQAEYPEAAMSLLRHIEKDAGLVLPLMALDNAAAEFRRQVDEQASQSDEIRSVIAGLETQYDTAEAVRRGRRLLEDDGMLPTGDEIGADFERYLAARDASDGDTENGHDGTAGHDG